MDPAASASPAHSSRKSQDLWNEWKAQIGMVRAALISGSPDSRLIEFISGCFSLYKDAYGCDEQCSAKDALASIAGRDCSPLEIAFMWLGGWRPTSAITLVYSTLSPLLPGPEEAFTSNYVETDPPTTSPLTIEQHRALEMLQKHARDAEFHLSNELATLQMLLPDQSMAEALTEDPTSVRVKDFKKGCELLDIKLAALTGSFIQANQLRLQTLEKLVCLLSPRQCAQCCVSAFELVHSLKILWT